MFVLYIFIWLFCLLHFVCAESLSRKEKQMQMDNWPINSKFSIWNSHDPSTMKLKTQRINCETDFNNARYIDNNTATFNKLKEIRRPSGCCVVTETYARVYRKHSTIKTKRKWNKSARREFSDFIQLRINHNSFN